MQRLIDQVMQMIMADDRGGDRPGSHKVIIVGILVVFLAALVVDTIFFMQKHVTL